LNEFAPPRQLQGYPASLLCEYDYTNERNTDEGSSGTGTGLVWRNPTNRWTGAAGSELLIRKI